MVEMGAGFDDACAYAACDAEIAFLDPELFDMSFVAHGDRLSVGGLSFRVLATPGHSADHMCLYQDDLGILFSGDLICPGLTPSIDMPRKEGEDAYRVFETSLDAVSDLSLNVTFPGHGDIIVGDIGQHIERVRAKKRLKLARVGDAVDSCVFGTGEQIARRFACCDDVAWDARRPMSRYYAMLETAVMLRHLENLGRIEKEFDARRGSYRYRMSL